MSFILRKRNKIDYRSLSMGENVRSNDRCKKILKRQVLEQNYYVERLIWKKTDSKEKINHYLVKWQDFDLVDSTWEPENHLSHHVVENYTSHTIDLIKQQQFAALFERTVQARLRSKNPVSVMFVELDVYRSLFGDQTRLLELKDFSFLNLPNNWFYRLTEDGHGRKIKFPVKITPRLHFRKVFVKDEGKLVKKSLPVERCLLYSCTEACSIFDL